MSVVLPTARQDLVALRVMLLLRLPLDGKKPHVF